MRQTYLSSRTMLEQLLELGLTKLEVRRRSKLSYPTIQRVLEMPYTYIPRPRIAEAIKRVYEDRLRELSEDETFRNKNEEWL